MAGDKHTPRVNPRIRAKLAARRAEEECVYHGEGCTPDGHRRWAGSSSPRRLTWGQLLGPIDLFGRDRPRQPATPQGYRAAARALAEASGRDVCQASWVWAWRWARQGNWSQAGDLGRLGWACVFARQGGAA